MNPYTFVPLPEPPARERPAGIDRFAGHSGTLRCRLTTRTPLFIYDPRFAQPAEPPAGQGHEVVAFPSDSQGLPVIPATALRGALRSVAEAASRSCLALFDGHYERWAVDYRPRLPDAYLRCDPAGPLCPACRLFGAVSTSQLGFASSVAISDAAPSDGVSLGERLTVSAIQSPKPHHQAFYLTAEGRIAGRKFYYHHPAGPTATIERSRFSRTVQPLNAGSVLAFTVRYRNLSDADLGLLLYALLLEPGLGHKIGMGKPIGLGSVTIALDEATNTAARDAALGRTPTPQTQPALDEWSAALTEPIRSSAATHLTALRSVLALDPGRPVSYPTTEWFRSHPTAPLADVPDIVPAPPTPQRAPERSPQRALADRFSRSPQRAESFTGPRAAPGDRSFPSGERQRRGGPQRGAERRREDDWEDAVEDTGATPPPRPVAEPAPSRPASLEDLVRRFSSTPERPARPEPAPTRESQRAREEQRRLMERLRRREE